MRNAATCTTDSCASKQDCGDGEVCLGNGAGFGCCIRRDFVDVCTVGSVGTSKKLLRLKRGDGKAKRVVMDKGGEVGLI